MRVIFAGLTKHKLWQNGLCILPLRKWTLKYQSDSRDVLLAVVQRSLTNTSLLANSLLLFWSHPEALYAWRTTYFRKRKKDPDRFYSRWPHNHCNFDIEQLCMGAAEAVFNIAQRSYPLDEVVSSFSSAHAALDLPRSHRSSAAGESVESDWQCRISVVRWMIK